MKHATAESLATITYLLDEIRAVPGLTERKPGVFYRKSQAFLHFHEDAAGMFADVKTIGGWTRVAVHSADEGEALLRRIWEVCHWR